MTVDQPEKRRADDAAARLWWGVRTYWWVVVQCLVLVMGLALALGRADQGKPVYRASALIITERLSIETVQFPSLAEAIFTSGSVANNAVTAGNLPYDPRDLIPQHAQIEPIEDSGALYVIGRDENPEVAVRTANATAQALEEELNRTGELGLFSLQSGARPELVTEEERLSLPLLIFMGGIAGGLAALGLVGLIMLIRRPALGASDAAELAGASALTELNLPQVQGKVRIGPESVGGLSSLAFWLFPEGRGIGALVSCKGSEIERSRIAVLLAQAISRSNRVVLVRSPDRRVEKVYEGLTRQPRLSVVDEVPPAALEGAGELVVIDGPTTRDQDAPQVLPPTAATLLVVKEGTPGRVVEAAGSQFLPGDLVGVLFIRSHGSYRLRPNKEKDRAKQPQWEQPGELRVKDRTPR
ncbi:MAG: hypothetical protein ACRDJL_05515 [Actinomycetota bacterium]